MTKWMRLQKVGGHVHVSLMDFDYFFGGVEGGGYCVCEKEIEGERERERGKAARAKR